MDSFGAMKYFSTQTFILLIYYFTCDGAVCNTSSTDLHEELFAGYDKRLPPSHNKGNTTLVLVQMYIITIDSVSEASMDYKLSMFLRQRWVDERLAFNVSGKNLDYIELDTSVMDEVWVPDLYILSEKTADFHDVTVPNRLMHIYPTGIIQYSMRVSGTFSCRMQFISYPFDVQNCKIEYESYGHSTKTILFRWRTNPVTKSNVLELPQYELTYVEPYTCDRYYYGILYSCLGVHLTFERNYGYFIIQIFIPSVLIVILSWINFWLDCDAVPARITVGLLTVLTLTTQLSGARTDLPRVSYVKAIDVWMAACLAFVVAALIEFAIVNVLARKERRKKEEESRCTSMESIDISPGKMGISDRVNGFVHTYGNAKIQQDKKFSLCTCFKNMAGKERARVVDKMSRVVFPLAFALFNAVYWIYYIILLEPESKYAS